MGSAVCDLDAVAKRLSIATTRVARQGASARLAGVAEALAEPFLGFFIERDMHRFAAGAETRARIDWIELAADADKLARWLDGTALGLRLVSGRPGVRAIAVGGRELRTD